MTLRGGHERFPDDYRRMTTRRYLRRAILIIGPPFYGDEILNAR